jgi:uncharacterized protein (DUF433 family)
MALLDQTDLAQCVPLEADGDGVIRVKGTRVTLDTVVESFQEGATAEEIAQQYPTLALAEVYAVIGYFLRQQTKVIAYLQQRQAKAARVRKDNESRFDQRDLLKRLMARRATK